MSALDFQLAMATLIRFPGEWAAFEANTRHLSLDDRERGRLREMAGDPNVRKFGEKMRYCRQRDALTVMRLSREYIDAERLTGVYRDAFEPTRTSTDFTRIGVHFLEFVLSHPDALSTLLEGRAWVRDLLRFDLAKAWTEREPMFIDDRALPTASRLRHRAFCIFDVEVDVVAVDQALRETPPRVIVPEVRAAKLMFTRSENAPYYRMFQIDAEIEAFLEAQRDLSTAGSVKPPMAFNAMVRAGLCRNES